MYQAKDFSSLLGTDGFSDNQLNTHFKLYEGYVANTNKVMEKLHTLQTVADFGPEYAEMKRRFGWEFGGMRLHEYYFENMTSQKKEFDKGSALAKKLEETFGSLDNAKRDFISTGSLRGIGWAVMTYDKRSDKIFHVWVNEHDLGHLVGTEPLLIMDVFEHAFVFDYGMKRAEYIEAFMNAVNWEEVNKRFDSVSR
ncbi:MAG: superoxide dismutase [Candidatus Magasanikbacteria bacterium CG11_big_fil_rev_8_21_14_0_20_39_34]|uniref:superoxide dismutase n=1 Tax=Candidatus Magasanikbacteria bacterium CG11_big_fil_rev_8_21_14_0_20_39_34 TaxID=1974653 RepID=A0A2H0N7J5_9BACT|nr:MAG: superoxide dismutase [Candidatus Magasanikbacteria bacterium CG11_big_fil_rev_8_21_14_0_20_39_34]